MVFLRLTHDPENCALRASLKGFNLLLNKYYISTVVKIAAHLSSAEIVSEVPPRAAPSLEFDSAWSATWFLVFTWSDASQESSSSFGLVNASFLRPSERLALAALCDKNTDLSSKPKDWASRHAWSAGPQCKHNKHSELIINVSIKDVCFGLGILLLLSAMELFLFEVACSIRGQKLSFMLSNDTGHCISIYPHLTYRLFSVLSS